MPRPGVQRMFIALIETQGNQPYIFASNREKAVRGASDLLYRSTSDWVIDAVSGERAIRTLEERSTWIRSQPPVGTGVHVVIATSGRAVLVAPEREALEAIVSQVTMRALRDAPGLAIAGAVAPLNLDEVRGFDDAFRAANLRLSHNLTHLGAPSRRMQATPVVVGCAETGLPSTHFDDVRKRPISAQVDAQLKAARFSRQRLGAVAAGLVADDVDDLVGDLSWRAVVRADGNAVGRLFAGLAKWFAPDGRPAREGNLAHIAGYRAVSMALEAATESAFEHAITSLPEGAVMPIVLGGDDIIAQVEAGLAVTFVREYLAAFENASRRACEPLAGISEAPRSLTSCAGIAVVKKHFPFSAAADLAESLLDSAKTAKDSGNRSAFDFHVSYDSTTSDLATIRSVRSAEDGLKLWGGPYVLGAETSSQGRSETALDLAREAIAVTGSGSQVHQMRDAARRGRPALERARKNAVHLAGRDREREAAIDELTREHDGHLLLIDALELADIDRKGTRR